ncbi:hypothetical protein N781_04930 [Pontibacillus halophilus JSM 076056 = DSM 19796]|uniref:50S ribosomal protein L9 n=1 Tax=Pontibacillus halophilus JSM 076056 = DSM 19796 TaxID=1385510 RepID=A0A0A5GIM4_9BACI|nr:hypothetical protein [Pontibacillus halophilus]KGX91058.1 hypothetical protein N781_04930 [Pontibacillus halophilus JSM 076056 = DSM 19796]
MVMNKDFLMGFVSGTVVGAVGYRLYEQNQGQLSQLIQNPGLGNQAQSSLQSVPNQNLTVEDLVAQKERLEDLIAEQKVNNQ